MKQAVARLLCRLGLHRWHQSRPLTLTDTFPPAKTPYYPPIRECRRCGKFQHWLPGYGGSEFGCWY